MSNLNKIEVILGLGLGLGYMTSLRFLGLVGFGELLILVSILLLLLKFPKQISRFNFRPEGLIKLYTFLSVFLVLPIVTGVVFFLTDYNSTPVYLISFAMGWLLAFSMVVALGYGLNMKRVTFYFALSFVVSNAISYFVFPYYYGDRFIGFASDPNQLMFYVSSLSLMLVLYDKKLLVLILPFVIWIGVITKSDSYFFQLIVIAMLYFVYRFLFSSKVVFYQKVWGSILFGLGVLALIIFFYADQLKLIWDASDEGGARIGLFVHAFQVALQSPLFGFGAGSFSGVTSPFHNAEAHNTFLDFSMQFGFLFPVLIYVIIFSFLIKKLKHNQYIEAAFVTAFIISGLFHYNGRHFIFWVEFAVFFYFVFYADKFKASGKS
jgi:hypothetical protein